MKVSQCDSGQAEATRVPSGLALFHRRFWIGRRKKRKVQTELAAQHAGRQGLRALGIELSSPFDLKAAGVERLDLRPMPAA
jgi:hypothetical protein